MEHWKVVQNAVETQKAFFEANVEKNLEPMVKKNIIEAKTQKIYDNYFFANKIDQDKILASIVHHELENH